MRANEKQFSSVWGEIKRLRNQNALKSLYKGVSTSIPSSFLPCLVFIYTYESINKRLRSIMSKNTTSTRFNYLIPLISNPIADLITLVIYLPFDITRTRLQVDPNYNGIISTLRTIINNEGYKRLYQASHLYIFYTILSTTTNMLFYEVGRSEILIHKRKNENLEPEEKESLNLKERLLLSMFVATCAVSICNPVDIILTRFQIADFSKKKKSARGIFKEILEKEGMKGFLKGYSAKLLYGNIFALSFYPIYDIFKTKYGISLHEF